MSTHQVKGQKQFYLTFKKVWRVLCLLRIDFYFFLFQFGTLLIAVPVNQLVQDKICLNLSFLNTSECHDLSNLSHETFENTKNYVLQSATYIKNYQNLVSLSPSIILSLFLGRWMDLYPGHTKYLLTLPCFGGFIQSLILIYQVYFWEIDSRYTIFSYISYGITGGETLVCIGSYTYVARKTAIDYRPLRFAVIEFFRLSAYPLASAIGGVLLSSPPWFNLGYRNYIGVFILYGLTKILTAVWVLVTLHDADESELTFQTNPGQPIEWKGKETNGQSFIANLFSLSSLAQVFQTSIRSRQFSNRVQLWHLILASSLAPWFLLCDSLIGFQFAQKVYDWNYEHFSYIFAIFGLVPMFFKPITTYILIHRYLFGDVSLAAIGNISMLINFTIRGLILHPLGYYSTIFTYFTSSLLPIGLRSIITRIVDFNEIAQILTISSLISSISPIIGTVFITNVFSSTIAKYPGIVYHFICMVLLYPLAVILGVDLTQRYYNNVVTLSEKQHKDSIVSLKIEEPNSYEVNKMKSYSINIKT